MDSDRTAPAYCSKPRKARPKNLNTLHSNTTYIPYPYFITPRPQKISPPKTQNFTLLTTLPPLRYHSPMYPSPVQTKWNDRFAFDLALLLEGSGEKLDELLERHEFEAADLLVFNKDSLFLKKVEAYREEVRTKGLTFRVKARAQAEELLKTSWLLIHDPIVSPAVKADLIKSTVKWAGLDTAPAGDGAGAAGGVTISINLGGQTLDVTAKPPSIPVEDAEYVDED